MNLSNAEKEQLTNYILNASNEVKEKFDIKIEDHRIVSFKGEAVVLKATKNRF